MGVQLDYVIMQAKVKASTAEMEGAESRLRERAAELEALRKQLEVRGV